ncbi:MAG: hypothetical protein H6983_12980 [Ectothiorhodospiraceae bacterium]|nr:hypothetical protein [Ectothiorhodospiraceae bacterium]
MVERSETLGGIESHVTALSFKSRLFATALGADRIDALDEDVFTGLCALIAPVRRRLGHHLAQTGFAPVRDAVRTLLDGAHDTTTTDARLDAFQRRFPAGRSHRWTRDLGAELLHFSDPERYPLMTRWIWDRAANTGVLREIWHAADLDHLTLDVPDRFETFLVLREELAGFLSDNGIFRDTLLYVDLLCAQVYSEYIAAQGGSFLRTDFAAAVDPMAFTRRMLGLDGIDPETGRTRFKRGDGAPHVVDQPSLPI